MTRYATAHHCVEACLAAGLEIEVAGGSVWVKPKERITPELAALIREAKPALLALCCSQQLRDVLLDHIREQHREGYGQPWRWFTEHSVWAALFGPIRVDVALERLVTEGEIVSYHDRKGQEGQAVRRLAVNPYWEFHRKRRAEAAAAAGEG